MNKRQMMSGKVVNEFFTNPGSPFKEEFHGKVMEDGTIMLVSDGIINTDSIIESYAPETDINNIITRVMAGELDLLEQKKGVYIDTIGMPKTYAQVLQAVIDGQNMFNALPLEIRQRFDNDFNKWFAQMDDKDWMIKSGFMQEKVIEKKEEVKDNG